MACVVIASPASASTLAAASRALAFLGLGSLATFLAFVLAGAARAESVPLGPGVSGAASNAVVVSEGDASGGGGSATGASGVGSSAAGGIASSVRASLATGASG